MSLLGRTVETSEPAHVPSIGRCLEWSGYRDRKGYGQLRHAGRTRFAHRVAWSAANGPIPDGLCVLHRCDNPSCVRADHLFLGTNADNVRDRDAKGRTPRGDASGSRLHPARLARGDANGSRLHPERLARGEAHGSRTKPERLARGEEHGSAKLTESDVKQIRSRSACGETHRAMGRAFGVSKSTIGRIVRLEAWQHVGSAPDGAPALLPPTTGDVEALASAPDVGSVDAAERDAALALLRGIATG